MKEVKRTPVPLPGSSKPTAKPKTNGVASKAQLSTEFVGSSDDDSSTENALQPKAVPKPRTTIAVHRPNGAAKTKASAGAKESATPKSTPKAKPAPKKATPKQIRTEEQAAEVLSSSEQTDDEEVPQREIHTKLPGNKPATDAASDSDSGSDSDSDNSSASSSDEAPPTSRAPPSTQEAARASKKSSHAVEFRPAQAYVPPKGYSAVSCNHSTTSKSTRIFDNLDGKQIWHITAPAGVSLTHLQEIAMDSALKGEAVLEHKGTSYAFAQADQSDDGAREVVVPGGDGFKSAGARIKHCLNLQAVVQLSHLTSKQADQNTGSEAAASITRSTIRAPRPQLKGLKMRFLPTGFGNGPAGTLGESDGEDDGAPGTMDLDEPNELQLPATKEKKKRKHVEVNGDVPADAPAKKSKKHRTPEEKEAKREKKRAREGSSTKP